jgi:ribosomal protein S18 acetylase RimI-like enzyme
MTPSDPVIRPARPGDVEVAIPLMYSSGPAAFDYVCVARAKGDVFNFLRYAFVRNLGEFGYTHHRVAELDGEVVGIAAHFSGEKALPFLLTGMRAVFGVYGPWHGAGVVRRALQIEKIVQPPKGKLHYIAHVGVAPELRGRGIGAQLMRHLLDEGRALGRTVAALDVSVENPRARELYLRLGFHDVVERKSTLENKHARVANHIRMERTI